MVRAERVACLRTPIILSLLLGATFACTGDLAGPRGQLLVQVRPAADSVLAGAPGRALPHPVSFRVLDAARRPLAGATVQWTVTGYGSRVEQAAAVTGPDGSFEAVWVLGTRASEVQRLRVDVTGAGGQGSGEVRAAAVPVEVAAISVVPETTAVLVGTPRVLRVGATDPFGNRFMPRGAQFTSLDTGIVTVDSLGTLRSQRGGFARVAVTLGAAADTAVVNAIQSVKAIGVDHDTLRFRSLQQIDSLKVWVVDDRGVVIRGLLPSVLLGDSSIARVKAAAPLTVTSQRNGSTTLRLQADSVVRQVAIVVDQQPAAIQATVGFPNPIYTAPTGSVVPLVCRVLDGAGYEIPIEATVAASSRGVFAGSRCSDVRVQRSGIDTLRVSSGSAVTTLRVAVAVPPVVSSPLGDFLAVDSLPEGELWAPSARRNSRGQLEVYFALGISPGDDYHYEDLHRLVSDDGTNFRYDGVVLRHDPEECSLTGYGFENIAIVPRQDAPGWRMYVSAGSFECYGWQVLSAVSTDERNWQLESGVRVGNGPSPSPHESIEAPYWPTGEGVTVSQLPSGGWRMLVGAYEHLNPEENKFQIIEWDSPDQLQWTYGGPVLTTRQMPPDGQGTVYGPNVREVAPGLWRMIFAGDNRFADGWRSRLWSAVSTDLQHWQVEGELIGSSTSNFRYPSLAGDRLVFLREDDGDVNRIAIATVAMP